MILPVFFHQNTQKIKYTHEQRNFFIAHEISVSATEIRKYTQYCAVFYSEKECNKKYKAKIWIIKIQEPWKIPEIRSQQQGRVKFSFATKK